MKIWILTTFLWCLVATTFGAHINNENSEESTIKVCTDERDPDFRLTAGQQGAGPRGSCMLVKCEDVVKGKSVLTGIGCGVFIATPGCKEIAYDKTKLYPDCCPNEIC